MKQVVVVSVVLLALLHQDFWWWDSRALVFDFMPIGLAWHALISLAAAIVWWLAVVYCWPDALDEELPDDAQAVRPQEVH